jgi:hypothetical protein
LIAAGGRAGNYRLFFKEIEKRLTMTVFDLGGGDAASLLFNKNLRLEQRAYVVGAFIDHPDLDRLDAFIAGRGIEVQAVPAGMKIRIALIAFIGDLYLPGHLYLRSAVVASRNKMEFCFNSSSGPPMSGRRLRFSFPV